MTPRGRNNSDAFRLKELPPRFAPLVPIRPDGSVIRARDSLSGNEVHLRRIERRAAALRETRLLARLASPFVPRVVALVPATDGAYWLATQWIEGEPLHLSGGLFPAWPTDLLRMLCHIHRWDVVHGDMKPSNVMQRQDGSLCITDFGCAMRAGEELGLQESGGTPGFVAPERLTGWPADPRSDLYSVARTVRVLAPNTHGQQPVMHMLAADTPTERPSTSADALRRVATVCGVGHIPEPDLAWAGWRSRTPSPMRLAGGLQAYLGVDAFVAHRLAAALLRLGGGNLTRTNALWREWLPQVCVDPWQGAATDIWVQGMKELRPIARRCASREMSNLSPASRWLISHQAQFVSPLNTARLLPRPAGYGRLRESSRFALTPGVEHPLVQELIHADVLRLVAGPGHTEQLAFATDSLVRAAAAELDRRTRRVLHQEIAAALAARFEEMPGPTATNLATVAWHEEQAGHTNAALGGYCRAAAKAFSTHDAVLASAIFRRAVRGAEQESFGNPVPLLVSVSETAGFPAGCPTVYDVVEQFAVRMSLAGHTRQAARWATWLRLSGPDASWRARASGVLADVHFRCGNSKKALAIAERAAADNSLSERAQYELQLHRARSLCHLRRLGESAEALAPIFAAPTGNGDLTPIRAQAHLLRGVLAMRHMRPAEAQCQWEIALEEARSAAVSPVVASASLNLGILHRMSGDTERATAYLDAARCIAEEQHFARDLAATLSAAAEFALRRHDWVSARRFGEMVFRAGIDRNKRSQVVAGLRRLARLDLHRGNLRSAERALGEAEALPVPGSRAFDKIRVTLDLLDLSLWYRDRLPDEVLWRSARKLLRDWEGDREIAEMRIYSTLRALKARVSPQRALHCLGPAPNNPEVAGWHDLAAARVAAANNAPQMVRRHIENCLQHFELARLGEFEIAFALLQAGLMEMRFDQPRARSLFDESAARARRIGSRWIEAKAILSRHQIGATDDIASTGRAGHAARSGPPTEVTHGR